MHQNPYASMRELSPTPYQEKQRSRIDHLWIDDHVEDLITHGFPRCTQCGKKLKRGSQVDILWPLSATDNVHRKCRHGETEA